MHTTADTVASAGGTALMQIIIAMKADPEALKRKASIYDGGRPV